MDAAEISATAAHQDVATVFHENKRVDPGPETIRNLGKQT